MPLSDLAAALAAATGPDRALDERMAVEVFGWVQHVSGEFWITSPVHSDAFELPELTASLDAITGAIREKWPGFRINAGWAADYAGVEMFADAPHFVAANAPSLVLALCLAAVRLALAEEGK